LWSRPHALRKSDPDLPAGRVRMHSCMARSHCDCHKSTSVRRSLLGPDRSCRQRSMAELRSGGPRLHLDVLERRCGQFEAELSLTWRATRAITPPESMRFSSPGSLGVGQELPLHMSASDNQTCVGVPIFPEHRIVRTPQPSGRCARDPLMRCDEIFQVDRCTWFREPSLLGFCHHVEKTMTKMTIVAAALVAAAAYTSEAAAARSNVAPRHSSATTLTSQVGNCVRAPDVGAFASAPYTSPPCMPGTAN